MANDTQNNILSDSSNPPGYLNFDALRNEGISYLGAITGKLWTDHNLHDPGITILEALCYALLDLDYRIKFPPQDIFAPDPSASGKDDNFYSPAEILGCNPLTILDYRKLLTDIDGVKNAWLEAAVDQYDKCIPASWQDRDNDQEKPDCNIFLNGLYHVYLQLEKDQDAATVSEKVKKALMKHRNFCEDFCDILILCPLETGVCADIELEATADVTQVYVDLVKKLSDFFSPSPQFYTLQQLLDKNKTIDEIFAGRPCHTTKSHGFLDTQELESIQLKKEIHLSDVYTAIFDVKGIKTIRNLQLNICDGSAPGIKSGWKYNIPKNYAPVFSTNCSGFRFTRNGKQLGLDTAKYNSIFDISQNKIFYKTALPYLDAAFPKGSYRDDLDDYYSIQNDFPNVYGISKGGIPADAPAAAKAHALQLKGYLLFFDQLLADYLAQLKNIRSLFSMKSSPAETQKTYFLNALNNGDQPDQPNFVPDVNKLWRLFVDDSLAAVVGGPGSTLVFPVSMKSINQLITEGKLSDNLPEDFTAFDYAEWDDVQDAVSLLKTDFSFEEDANCRFVQYNSGCWYYYMVTTSDDIVLVSKKNFPDKATAQQHATYVLSCAMFDENYSVFSIPGSQYTFTIDISGASIAQYLQSILENQDGYVARRTEFLDHLLSRFAENFTDYALLLYGSSTSEENELKEINAKEKFLTHYAELSCNRGKAYDYVKDNWNNKNISGFEKKVKALSGISNWKRHDLCNFLVTKYEEQYILTITITGQEFFTISEKFDSTGNAQNAAISLVKALCDRSRYKIQHISYEQSYAIEILYEQESTASFIRHYSSREYAEKICERLYFLFKQEPSSKDIFISSYIYRLRLKDHTGKTCKTAVDFYRGREEAMQNAPKAVKSINLENKWKSDANANSEIGTLHRDKNNPGVLRFIDTIAFKIDIDNTIVNKPDKFTYELLNATNAFKFLPLEEFDEQRQAKAHAINLLFLAADVSNYVVEKRSESNRYALYLVWKEKKHAVSHIEYISADEASSDVKRIQGLLRQHLYEVVIDEEPYRWKFQYHLGYEDDSIYRFVSDLDFENTDNAMAALANFIKNMPSLQFQEGDEKQILSPKKEAEVSPARIVTIGNEQKSGDPKALLLQQQAIVAAVEKQDPADFADIRKDALSLQGQYAYQLVDKDDQVAACTNDYPTITEAENDRKKLIDLLKQGIGFLQICLDGDVLRTHKDECNQLLYHFIIKCQNEFTPSGQPLVLFESVIGYPSPDEAIVAFKAGYLQIIDQASDPVNYGTIISLTELYLSYNSNKIFHSIPTVFIPVQTKNDLGGTDPELISKLVALASSYPIRIVQQPSDKFSRLFCKREKKVISSCDSQVIYVYYYRLLVADPLAALFTWQSISYYNSEAEAREAFTFFLLLLKYTGNLYTDCYNCDQVDSPAFRILIREVLAVSIERFLTEDEAWGANGIEKFICAEQTGHGMHAYQRADDCCYSFFVTCGDPVIKHPCLYDTADKRSVVKDRLYREYLELNRKKAFEIEMENENWILTDDIGTPFANVNFSSEEKSRGDLLFDLFDNIANEKLTFSEINGYPTVENAGVTIQSIKNDFTKGKLKEKLEDFVYYFPVIRNDEGNFAIEIKLPGFNTHRQDKTNNNPSCDDPVIPDPPCYIAWKGTCYHNNLDTAMAKLETAKSFLVQYNYYLSSFECDCHSFGIKLAYPGELIALNPQCYPTRDMACEAIERADSAVNSEGLHVVEHILLRTDCKVDCECRDVLYCPQPPMCGYTWHVPDTDPCLDIKNICFIPGQDPYSFIATVVLPAWPKTFRDPEKRLVIENIIYGEAPAHVLLRILWLAPHDFCSFETKFRQWGKWLAMKKDCIAFSTCDFLQFLFTKEFECLPACTLCQPCSDQSKPQDPCAEATLPAIKDISQEFSNQIDQLYCWIPMNCNSEQTKDQPDTDDSAQPKDIPLRLHVEPLVVVETDNENKIDQRFTKYRDEAKSITLASKKNDIAAASSVFLQGTPDLQEYKNIIELILKNQKPKGKTKTELTITQRKDLASAVTFYYLDTWVFSSKKNEIPGEFKSLINNLKKAGIKPEYKKWDAKEVTQIKSAFDTKLVSKLLK